MPEELRIGIIDDEHSECEDIQVSILDNLDARVKVGFKEYTLPGKTKEKLFNEIQQDVLDETVSALIVDFRLDTEKDIIEGWEIIKYMHDQLPEFPVIIMTNAPEESRESDYTDADKVYAKKIFLNPEKPETKELVKNMLLNIAKYRKHRTDLEKELESLLERYVRGEEDEQFLQAIIRIEDDLGRYKNMSNTETEKALDLTELKEVLNQLMQYERMLKQ